MHQISRRLFMGSVAGAGAGLALPLVTIAEPRQEADPVLMHVGREMARLYKQQRSGRFFAEHYASLASNLRLMALVFPDIRALATRKPSRHHDTPAEHLKRAEEVRRQFGIDISGEPMPAPLSAAEEAKARAQLALEGLGPTLVKMAELADARGRDRARNGNAPHVHRVQYNPYCVYMPVLKMVATLVCIPVAALLNPALYMTVCSVAMVTQMVWEWVC